MTLRREFQPVQTRGPHHHADQEIQQAGLTGSRSTCRENSTMLASSKPVPIAHRPAVMEV